MKNIGKPSTGKPYARFDEGGQGNVAMVWILRHRRTKGAVTDRPDLRLLYPALYSTLIFREQIIADLKQNLEQYETI